MLRVDQQGGRAFRLLRLDGALPARVAARFDAHQQALLEIGVRPGEEAGGNRLSDLPADETIAEGDVVVARDMARVTARVRATVGDGGSLAVDHADLAILEVAVVLQQLV